MNKYEASKYRQEVMQGYSVHNLTKQVLELTKNKDVIDRYYDVKLALDVLKKEMDASLNDFNYNVFK